MSSNSSNHDRYRFRWSLLSPGNGLTWVGLVCFFVVTLLPMSLTDRIGSFIGRSVARRNRRRFNIVETNLSLCFPEKKISEIREMVLDHFQVQIRSVVHYFILWWRPASVVRKKIKMSGFEKVEQYQEQGKKVIILLLHNVGLEFAVAAISMEHAMTGPYKVMKNPVLNWLVVRSRMRFGRKHGIKLFTREDGLRPLIRETRVGKILVYLGDEDLGKKNAVFVPFFGVQKATIPVLGRLAKACDAVVLPCVCLYQPEERNYSVQLMPEIEGLSGDDDVADSLKMNQAIEQAIRLCPEQYMWTLRYFKTRPPGEASCYG